MSRRLAVLVFAVYTLLLAAAAASRGGLLAFAERTLQARTQERQVGYGQIRFRGKGPEAWAARFRRERRMTIVLRHQLAAKVSRLVYLVDAFECVHRYEGAWTANTGNGYRGGLQFGPAEWRLYGGEYAPSAELAAPSEQIAAGIAYHAVAGFWPWPQTARRCGLIR